MTTHTTTRSTRRLAAAGLVAATGLALTGGGVFAALNANASNTTAEAVGSGTLKLTLADNGAGFTTAISNLAPGDTVNRFVNLSNSGTLDASTLTLKVADSVNSKLTTDAALGLNVSVSTCTVAWTTAGACTSPTTVISAVPLSTLKTTPSTVLSTIAAGGSAFLKLSLVLPDQTETTVNGVLPGATIQGLTAALTWTFTEQQRTATTTNS